MVDITFIIIALISSYFLVSIPEMERYSLQMIALLILLYFGSKRLSGGRWHHLLPSAATVETAIFVAAGSLAVGGTGGLDSPFFAVVPLIIFISLFSLSVEALLVLTAGISLFLWGVTIHPLTTSHWVSLAILPLLLPFLLLIKRQLEEKATLQHRQFLEEAILSRQETSVLFFLGTFLKPKLVYVRTMLRNPDHHDQVEKQLQLIEAEVTQIIGEIDASSDSLESPNKIQS